MESPLKPLFISKVRIKLLELFLTNPEELYYVRELVRITEEEINAVRRELGHMEEAKMVTKENRGNRLYYKFNTKHLLYEDLLSMVAKTTGLGEQFIRLRSKLGKIKAIMFSFDFVEQKPTSSEAVDIVIIGQVVLPEVNALIQAEESKRGREINYTVLDQEEYKFRRSKRDPFLLSLLMLPKIMIIGSQQDFVSAV